MENTNNMNGNGFLQDLPSNSRSSGTDPFSPLKDTNQTFLMRAVVVDRIEGSTEGVISVYIPKLFDTGGRDTGTEKFEKTAPEFEEDPNDGDTDAPNAFKKSEVKVKQSNFLLARPSTLFGGIGQKIVPSLSQVVYCFMEDDDPLKLYYLPLTPTLLNQALTIPASRFSKENIKDEKKSADVVVMIELPNGLIISLDYNTDTNSFEIAFPDGTGMFIANNEKEKYIELTNDGNSFKLDSKNKKVKLITEGELECNVKGRTKLVCENDVSIKGRRVFIN